MNRKRTAVVLAASGGIGRACAEKIAEQGDRVVLFSRSAAKLEDVASQITARGGEAAAVVGDISSAADLKRLFEDVERRFGGTDILINNGPGPKGGDTLSLTDEDFEASLREQVLPILRAVRHVVPGMAQRKWGRIVTIGSIAAKMPIDGLDLSNFARAGLAGLHRSLARSLARQQINVHYVLPGTILTQRTQDRIAQRAAKQNIRFEDALAQSAASVPMGRLGEPDEVGHLVAFLCSDRASYLAGDFIQVDGGLYTGLL
jgi:3-oxoacyl-[acyl-carrier protein] reductase